MRAAMLTSHQLSSIPRRYSTSRATGFVKEAQALVRRIARCLANSAIDRKSPIHRHQPRFDIDSE
jgi:hypothetical protein